MITTLEDIEMRRERLCIVTWGFPPAQVGGAEIAAYELAKRLSKYFEVHVVTSRANNMLPVERRRMFKVHYVKVMLSRFNAIRFVTRFLSFMIEIRKISPNVIYARSFAPAGFIGAFYGAFHNTPCFVQCEGIDILSAPFWYRKTLGRFIMKYATRIISATRNMAEKIAQDYSVENVLIIENGVNLSEFKDAEAKDLPYKKPRIVFVGRIDRNKGVKYLIKAFLQLRKRMKQVSLLIVGHGPLREKLASEYRFADGVYFLGRIPHEEIPKYFASCDLFVLPSVIEGQGLVLMEALASGLPIIASDVGGISELIEEGKNGFLMRPCDENQLAERMELILNDANLSKEIGKNNIEKAKLHDWEDICKKYVKLFRRCRQ